MKAGIIAPIPLLEDYCSLTDYHVCRAGLLSRNEIYRNFYREKLEKGQTVIVDSAKTEPRRSASQLDVMSVAEQMGPTYVVAPDWDVNATKTIGLVSEFIWRFGPRLRSWGVKILGMVQGANMVQLLECYKTIQPIVDAIGLPRNVEASVGYATFLKRIRTKKPIHIFGIHACPEDELDSLNSLERENIIGLSSSLPVRLGFLCRLLDEYRPEPPPIDWLNASNPFPEFTKKNVEEFILMAEGEL